MGGCLERYLYLGVQAAIDLAEATLAYKNFRKPSTLSDAFYILNEENIIDSALTERLANMTGFRNVIAHDYEKINYDIVFDVLHNRTQDIEAFLSAVSQVSK